MVKLNGGDKNRCFSDIPVTDPDFKIVINNKDFFIEQITDYVGAWKKTKEIALRSNKYLFLRKEKGLLLGVDLKNNLFIFIDDIADRKVRYDANFSGYNGKPTYLITIFDDDFLSLSDLEKKIFTLDDCNAIQK